MSILGEAALPLVLLAILLNIPGVMLKSLRWRWFLQAQHVPYGILPSSLAYFGSIFVGLFTLGRLGEFVKALHISRDCGISAKQAFSSVLADRLFDLYALAIVGGLALATLGNISTVALLLSLGLLALALVTPMVLLLNGRSYSLVQSLGLRLGRLGRKLFDDEGWVTELRAGLMQLSPPWLAIGVLMTVLAYMVFYIQVYLLAQALSLAASVATVCFAVALGSLVTLIPISISGIGTREAAVVAYLSTANVSTEAALGFSLLVFITFYLGTAVIGAVAWMIKPANLKAETPA